MVTCEIYQRQFKTEQTLSGHRRFKHSDTDETIPVSRDGTQMATQRDIFNLGSELLEA